MSMLFLQLHHFLEDHRGLVTSDVLWTERSESVKFMPVIIDKMLGAHAHRVLKATSSMHHINIIINAACYA